MSGLNAGDFDREVTIQAMTESIATDRSPVESWSDLDTVFMALMPTRAQERFRAAQVSAPIESRWLSQYHPELDPDLVNVVKTRRLVFAGRVYDITGAQQIGRQEGIELMTLAKGDEEPS